MSGTIARKTGSLHVHVFGLQPVCAINFSRDQSSNKLINFLNSRLNTPDLRLDPRDSRLDNRNYRGSRIEARGTVNLLLSSTVAFIFHCFLKINVSRYSTRMEILLYWDLS